MTYLASSVPNLINGISQQPSAFKLATQAEHQLNGVSSVVKGLTKRPPTEHKAVLHCNNINENSFIHTLDYGLGEFYTLVIGDSLNIFDKDGHTVELDTADASEASVTAYLSGLTLPKDEIVATTIADQTYIINKNTVVKKGTAKTTKGPYEGLFYVKQGDYDTEYKISVTVGDQKYSASYTTRDSSHEDHFVDTKTSNIINALVNGTLNTTDPVLPAKYATAQTPPTTSVTTTTDTAPTILADGTVVESTPAEEVTAVTYVIYGVTYTAGSGLTGGLASILPEGVEIEVKGSTIRVHSLTKDFKIEATDDRGGSHIDSFKGQVDDFKKLPKDGPLGFKIRVVGNTSQNQDDYYLELQDPENNGNPVWKETTADSIEYQIDNSTMPHVLVKEPNGTWHFKEMAWDDRKVGDDDTNPFPSFIGQTLNDLFFYRNRLGLLSGENVILSEVGSFWNFFHTTTLVLSDAAVVDIAVGTDVENELKYAIPFNSSLMLFSDRTQFIFSSGQVLAHDTANVEVSTRFEADLRCKPTGASTFVFFATKRGEYGGLREYYVADDSDANDAENVTSHVPEFIEGGIKRISASTTEDMVLLLSTSSPNEVYVYNYFWSNKEKKQSAWHKWDFGAPVLSAEFVNSKLVLIVEREIGQCLEVMNLSADTSRHEMSYGHGLHLDRRVRLASEVDVVNNPLVDSSIFAGDIRYYNNKGAFLGDGALMTPDRVRERLLVGETVYAGVPYCFEYRFSEFLLRNEGRPIKATKLKLKKVTLDYDQTGAFEVLVTPSVTTNNTRANYSKFFGLTISSIHSAVSVVNIDSGSFSVPVWGDATAVRVTLKNETAYPCSFQTAEWAATFSKHERAS